MLRKSIVVFFISATILTITFLVVNRSQLFLKLYLLPKPCHIYFLDADGKWSVEKKAAVLEACQKYAQTGQFGVFDDPIIISLSTGNGGATTTGNLITFDMSEVFNSDQFRATALHELAHIIDARRGNLSTQSTWLGTSGWLCNNLTCTHPCQQTTTKAFFCSYKNIETLPSRYGTADYDPTQSDVSINPAEDFAEASRYFWEAPLELAKTSPSRYKYLLQLYHQN